MNRKVISYIVYAIMMIAVMGFIYQLTTKPTAIVSTAFTIGISILIVYILFRLFTSLGSDTSQKNYKKAVKQSAQKYKQSLSNRTITNNTNKKNHSKSQLEPIRKKAKSKSTAKLTVIEGDKGKKKNRAHSS